MLLPLLLVTQAAPPPLPLLPIDRDNVEVTQSCRLDVTAASIPDLDGNGVVHVTAGGVTIEMSGPPLHGAAPAQAPDTYSGTGIVITAPNVTLRGARVSGYRCGIKATGADGLIVENCDLSGNFRQRLRSSPSAEDGADWLWPHANDDHEWLTNYGAAICVEGSRGVTLRRVRVRDTQNGIILDRVTESRIYDNDCSFLSGWGLALWRSSENVISRNAFDFCIRGYSHGVYNRGQDSAGILMFEQCSKNRILENSVTHGGDGIFIFAGKEALGEVDPRSDPEWYRHRGCNNNVIAHNDFSDAAAHGVEVTFSFGNRIDNNRLVGNAICGIWGGYSQNTMITGNEIADNGEMGYGAEHGGVNIEHGRGNAIIGNRFRGNRGGVFLWWDDDPGLLETPWGKVNRPDCAENTIARNVFEGDDPAIKLRRCDGTAIDPVGVPPMDYDEHSALQVRQAPPGRINPSPPVASDAVGSTSPVGARSELAGRDHIIMTEWGPYDWAKPMLRAVERTAERDVWELLGAETAPLSIKGLVAPVGVTAQAGGDGRLVVTTSRSGAVQPYELTVAAGGRMLTARGIFQPLDWSVTSFAWTTDPRIDHDAWLAESAAAKAQPKRGPLELVFGGGGPGADLPADRFGTIAETTVRIPAGRWRLETTSDDGIRVWLGDALVIDDWTWHPPKRLSHQFELKEPATLPLRVEHFELDGYALLEVRFEPAE